MGLDFFDGFLLDSFEIIEMENAILGSPLVSVMNLLLLIDMASPSILQMNKIAL